MTPRPPEPPDEPHPDRPVASAAEESRAEESRADEPGAEETPAVAPRVRPRRRRGVVVARDVAFVVVVAVVLSALLRAFVLQAFSVPTGSMNDTIRADQRILVTKFGDVERGEVVVFEDPGGWISALPQAPADPGPVRESLEWVGLLPSSADDHLVKRVVGLPGDRVVCCDRDGRIRVNGVPLEEEAYLFPGDRPSATEFDVTVPAGAMWVMGDHRSDSGDSRCHVADGSAFVPLDLVTGRAVATIWPLDDLRGLGVPATYEGIPAGVEPPADGVVAVPSDCLGFAP